MFRRRDLPALEGLAGSFPGSPGEGLVIWQAEIVAESRAVEQPESELRLVRPVPGEPSFKRTGLAPTQQPAHGFESLMGQVADSSPEQVSEGEILHELQHQNRHERDEGVLDEEAEPIPGKPTRRAKRHGRRLA